MFHRGSFVLILVAALGAPAAAQVNLAETRQPGDLARYQIELSVHGKLFVSQDGKPQDVPLTAKAKHHFVEKTLTVADGLSARSLRLFDEASASALVGSDKDDHRLPADRKLFVAARTADGLFCFAPAGAVTREELDLVSEHFDPHCLPGLLPGKAVNVGDMWAIGNAAAQAAGLFDSLIKNSLTGKLIEVKDGIATFAITGAMEGIENGAKVTLTIDTVGRFQVDAGRIVALTWKQTDDREQGPASPASKLEAVVLLQREKLAEEPKEL